MSNPYSERSFSGFLEPPAARMLMYDVTTSFHSILYLLNRDNASKFPKEYA